MTNQLQRKYSSIWAWVKGVLLVSLIIIIWSVSFCIVSLALRFLPQEKLPESDGLMTLLFGASSIALFLFSIIFAVLAIAGWERIREQLEYARKLREEVRSDVDKLHASTQARIEAWGRKVETIESERIIPLEKEMKGRAHSVLGYVLGEMSLTSDRLRVVDEDRLREAVALCQRGYNFLKTNVEDDPAEFLALNNLVFYLCFTGDQSRSQFLLEQSRRLMKAAQRHDNVTLLLTSCRAILLFSSDNQEKKDACITLASIAMKPHATLKEKKEARDYLASFSQLVVPP